MSDSDTSHNSWISGDTLLAFFIYLFIYQSDIWRHIDVSRARIKWKHIFFTLSMYYKLTIFILCKRCPDLPGETSHLSIQWLPRVGGGVFRVVKRSMREADYSTPSSAEVMNEWRSTPPRPIRPFVALVTTWFVWPGYGLSWQDLIKTAKNFRVP